MTEMRMLHDYLFQLNLWRVGFITERGGNAMTQSIVTEDFFEMRKELQSKD